MIGFFELAKSKYYFVCRLYMQQGKSAGNVDIHHRVKQLPTTMNAVINDVLDSSIVNDHCGSRKIFLDNRHACPEIFAVLFE